MKTTQLSPNHRRDILRSRQSASVRWRVFIVGTLILGFMSAGTVYAGEEKDVPICQLDDTGNFVLQTVTQAQYDRFIADGDGEWKALEQFS